MSYLAPLYVIETRGEIHRVRAKIDSSFKSRSVPVPQGLTPAEQRKIAEKICYLWKNNGPWPDAVYTVQKTVP